MGFEQTPIFGIPVPDGAAPRRQLPTHLLTIATELEKHGIYQANSVNAVYTKFPDPADRPAIIQLPSGCWQHVGAPYNVYAPIGRVSHASAGSLSGVTPTVGPPPKTQSYGTTQPLTVGPYPWPHIITVKYRGYHAAEVNTDVSLGFVNVTIAGSTVPTGNFRLTGDGTVICNFDVERYQTSDLASPTILTGGLGRVAGTGDTQASIDPAFTDLEVTIAPYLDAVGS